jgi:CelD/BcsL family acetyltransferase involved in cellulose biosynthesis
VTTRAIERLYEEWDDLATRVDAPPWYRPGWLLAWREAFGIGDLDLVVVRREGRLVGLVPLEKVRGEVRSASNGESPSFGFLVEDEDAALEIAERLFGRRDRRITLFLLTQGSYSLDVCRTSAEENGFRVLVRMVGRSPFLDTTGEWSDYEAALSTKMLREMRRRKRRLEEEGQLSFEVEDGAEDLERLLTEGFFVEGAGWKTEQGGSIIARPAAVRFYREVSRWAASRGELCLAFLRLDGRPIAFDLSLEDGKSHYLLKTGFHPDLRKFGPGTLIRRYMIARAFSLGFKSYEFLGHDESWKYGWTDTFRDRFLFRAFAPSLTGLLDWSAFAYGGPVKRAIEERGR